MTDGSAEKTKKGGKKKRKVTKAGGITGYETGAYWASRTDLLYYQYVRYIIRCVGHDAASLIDVGSGNAPYLEWFDWIPERVSVDLDIPYQSENVRGIKGSILDLDLPRHDICTCLQVLEHVPEPHAFARKLLGLGDLLIISVPFQWPKGLVKTHLNDPVDLKDVIRWFGVTPNYHITVREPFRRRTGARLIAIFDPLDPSRKFGAEIRKKARPL